MKRDKILVTRFATDFFLPKADEWRKRTWTMIRKRTDIDFLILTKRIDCFLTPLPLDREDRYDNINIGCTMGNRKSIDERLPPLLSYPIKGRLIACAPSLEATDLTPCLHGADHVSVGGEIGREAREYNYDWVPDTRGQYVEANVTFWLKSTGSLFRRGRELRKINPFKETGIVEELGISILGGERLF